MSPSPSSSNPSLLAQRKHRKLLKDGSGSEVWPESLERVFLEGLRQYWDSPWATYSRGRSRWRNQFLVDYLENAGITRTKKQVASHIQVLRNMLRGRPEFVLVAGGDEVVSTDSHTGITTVKTEDGLLSLNLSEIDMNSTSKNSASRRSPRATYDLPSTTGIRGKGLSLPSTEYSPDIYMAFPNASLHDLPSSPETNIGYLASPATASSSSSSSSSLPPHSYEYSGSPADAYSYGGPSTGNWLADSGKQYRTDSGHSTAFSPHSANRATFFCLAAEGMTPFQVKLDSLLPPSQPTEPWRPAMLKLKVTIPRIDELRCSNTLNGFVASVRLKDVWGMSATCLTRTYTGNTCLDERTEGLQPTSVDSGAVSADLPDSWLSRCRWLDASQPSCITQQVIVDGQSVLYLVYEVDRSNGSYLPSVALVNYQRKQPRSLSGGSTGSPTPTRVSMSPHPIMPMFAYHQNAVPNSGAVAAWQHPSINSPLSTNGYPMST